MEFEVDFGMRCALVRTRCREGRFTWLPLHGIFRSCTALAQCAVYRAPLDAAAENSGTWMSGGRAWQFPHFPISSFPCDPEYTPRPAPGPRRRSPRPVGRVRATGTSSSFVPDLGVAACQGGGHVQVYAEDRQWLSTPESDGAGGGVAFRGAGCHIAAGGNRIRYPGVDPS